jgi:alpha-galactosidase/6-phospho-beta-glucosidase family protein
VKDNGVISDLPYNAIIDINAIIDKARTHPVSFVHVQVKLKGLG